MPQRSPIIFWLLLAATISVDAIVFPLAVSNAPTAATSVYFIIAFDALIVSQLSIVCIWAALHLRKILWVPALVAVVVAAFTGAVFSDAPYKFFDSFKLYLAYYGLVASLLLAVLWMFRGSKYWRRRTGVAHNLQYSLAQLLIAMTVAAVLMTTMRSGPFKGDEKWINIAFACSVVALAVVSAVIWSASFHWFLRLAATLGAAILLAVVFCYVTDSRQPFEFFFVARFLIQGVVLSAWLGWGPILPLSAAAAEREPQQAAAP